MTQPWTVEQVAARLAEAAQTAERLPPVRVQGYFNTWPEFKRQPWEALARDGNPDPRFPPSPEAVERMIEVSRWMLWLTAEQRHLAWMRARNDGWKAISRRLACDRTTAWRRWQTALKLIAIKLNHPSAGDC